MNLPTCQPCLLAFYSIQLSKEKCQYVNVAIVQFNTVAITCFIARC